MKRPTVLIPGSQLKPGDVVRVNGDDYTIHVINVETPVRGPTMIVVRGNTGTGCHCRTLRKPIHILWSVVPPASADDALAKSAVAFAFSDERQRLIRTEPTAYGPVPGPPVNPANVKPLRHVLTYQTCGVNQGGNATCDACGACYCLPPWTMASIHTTEVCPGAAPEWEFKEQPHNVDLMRLWRELLSATAIEALVYLGELRKRAPLTYQRLRAWRIAEGCVVFDWNVKPGGAS